MKQAERKIRDFLESEIKSKLESQSALAKKNGVTRNQINEFLRGKRDIKLATLLNHLQALNITLKLIADDHSSVLLITPDDMRQLEFDQFL